MFQELVNSIPKITLYFCGFRLALMVITKLGLIDPLRLFFFPDAIFEKGEIWRFITGPIYEGPINKNNLFSTFIGFMNFRIFEISQFPYRKSQLVFVIIMTCIVSMLVCSLYNPVYAGFTLSSSLNYINSKLNPDTMFSIIIFQIPGKYMPFVTMAISLVLNGSLIIPLLGIIIGHIVYFLLYVMPLITNKALFKVPDILVRYID